MYAGREEEEEEDGKKKKKKKKDGMLLLFVYDDVEIPSICFITEESHGRWILQEPTRTVLTRFIRFIKNY